jgi:hypothetical protein
MFQVMAAVAFTMPAAFAVASTTVVTDDVPRGHVMHQR